MADSFWYASSSLKEGYQPVTNFLNRRFAGSTTQKEQKKESTEAKVTPPALL